MQAFDLALSSSSSGPHAIVSVCQAMEPAGGSSVALVPARSEEAIRSEHSFSSLHQQRRKRQQLLIAIRLCPQREKTAYKEAMLRAPHLVELESPLLDFIACEDGDASRAAGRLLRYWTLRKKVFQDRFLLPMDVTGEGALDVSDINLLQSASLAILPSNSATGRSLLYEDASAGNQESLEACRDRCHFYMFSLALRTTSSDLDVLRLALATPSPDGSLEIYQNLLESLPLHSKTNLYLCWSGPCSAERQAEVEARVQARLGLLQSRVHCLYVEQPAMLSGQLQSMGLSLAQLPEAVGGPLYLAATVNDWMAHQCERDHRHHSNMVLESSLVEQRKQVHEQEKLDFEDEAARSRRRQRRRVERGEFKALQGKFLDLSATKLRLGEEQVWLRTTITQLSELLLLRDCPGGPGVLQAMSPFASVNLPSNPPVPAVNNNPVRGSLPNQETQALLGLFQQRFVSSTAQVSVAEATAGSLGAQQQIEQLHQAGWSSLSILQELRNQVLAVKDGDPSTSALLSLLFLFQALLVYDSSLPSQRRIQAGRHAALI